MLISINRRTGQLKTQVDLDLFGLKSSFCMYKLYGGFTPLPRACTRFLPDRYSTVHEPLYGHQRFGPDFTRTTTQISTRSSQPVHDPCKTSTRLARSLLVCYPTISNRSCSKLEETVNTSYMECFCINSSMFLVNI